MPHPFTSQKDQMACIHNSFMLFFWSNDKSKTRGRWWSTWLQHRPLTDPGCLILHWRSCWMMTSDNVNVSLIRITIRRAGLSGRGLHPTLRAWKREWPGECQCTVLLAIITQGIPSKCVSLALIIPKMILGKDVWLPTIVGKPTELQSQSQIHEIRTPRLWQGSPSQKWLFLTPRTNQYTGDTNKRFFHLVLNPKDTLSKIKNTFLICVIIDYAAKGES